MRISLFICLLLSFMAPAAATTLRICTVEWPPLTTVGADGATIGGTHTERVRAAVTQAGFVPQIEAIAWERCLHDLATGSYDAAYSASYKDDRAMYAVYPQQALESLSYVAVVRRGSAAGWDQRHDFRQLPQPLASPHNWSMTLELKTKPGIQVDDGSLSSEQDVRKLLSARVGSVIAARSVAEGLLGRLDSGHRLEILAEPVVAGKDYFIIISRKFQAPGLTAQQLADRLDVALREHPAPTSVSAH